MEAGALKIISLSALVCAAPFFSQAQAQTPSIKKGKIKIVKSINGKTSTIEKDSEKWNNKDLQILVDSVLQGIDLKLGDEAFINETLHGDSLFESGFTMEFTDDDKAQGKKKNFHFKHFGKGTANCIKTITDDSGKKMDKITIHYKDGTSREVEVNEESGPVENYSFKNSGKISSNVIVIETGDDNKTRKYRNKF